MKKSLQWHFYQQLINTQHSDQFLAFQRMRQLFIDIEVNNSKTCNKTIKQMATSKCQLEVVKNTSHEYLSQLIIFRKKYIYTCAYLLMKYYYTSTYIPI